MNRELLIKLADALYDFDDSNPLLKEIDDALAEPEPETVAIVWPEYHYQGMGCGIEDRNIHDRYDACRYGWDCAIEAVAAILPEHIYTQPQCQNPVYLSDDDILKLWVGSDTVRPILGKNKVLVFARAVLHANGLLK